MPTVETETQRRKPTHRAARQYQRHQAKYATGGCGCTSCLSFEAYAAAHSVELLIEHLTREGTK